MRTLAILLLLTAPAFGEYCSGFSLYGHVAEAESVVLATMDAQGGVEVLDLVWGKPIPGGALTLDPERIQQGDAREDRRAFLFLTEGRVVGEWSGVGWIRDDRVELLPDNWGYGWMQAGGYRAPMEAQFRKSVVSVARHVAEVRRIARMEPGRDRILALSRLLSTAADEFTWYIFIGDSIASIMHLGPRVLGARSLGSQGRGYNRTYIEEVRTALLASIDNWSGEEQEALMAAIRDLPPGRSRREHLEILICAGVPGKSGKELTRWFLFATEIREKVVLARALRTSNPVKCRAALLVQIHLEGLKGEGLVVELLALLRADEEDPLLHLTVRRLARDLLAAGKDPKGGRYGPGGLGRQLVDILFAVQDDADLGLLLRFARSPLSCRSPALANLRTWAKKEWEADDDRWDRLLAK